jgi:hypothetical protein
MAYAQPTHSPKSFQSVCCEIQELEHLITTVCMISLHIISQLEITFAFKNCWLTTISFVYISDFDLHLSAAQAWSLNSGYIA